VSDQDQRYDSFAGYARPDEPRVARSIAVTLTGLAIALGGIASIDVPPAEQILQDLVFGAVLGATYGVTVLGARAFDVRVVGTGFGLLLIVTTALWFVGLKPQFAFASTTVFVVGQLLSLCLAAALRGASLSVGALLVVFIGIAIGWLLFNYLDPRIELLTGIRGWGNDRLLGSPIVVQAAMIAAAATIWGLTRPAERPAAP